MFRFRFPVKIPTTSGFEGREHKEGGQNQVVLWHIKENQQCGGQGFGLEIKLLMGNWSPTAGCLSSPWL